jgi:FtsX-like permease family
MSSGWRFSGTPAFTAATATNFLLPILTITDRRIMFLKILSPLATGRLLLRGRAIQSGSPECRLAMVRLLLASVGVFGVISYGVSQRTREIGIRMALGAARKDVLSLVVGQGMKPLVIGVVAGAVSALMLAPVMSSLLFGVGPNDPVAFAGSSVFLVLVVLLACYVPARRAARVDPMVALRYE